MSYRNSLDDDDDADEVEIVEEEEDDYGCYCKSAVKIQIISRFHIYLPNSVQFRLAILLLCRQCRTFCQVDL